MKLNLGCGTKLMPDFLNVDIRQEPDPKCDKDKLICQPDVIDDIATLAKFKDDVADLIYCINPGTMIKTDKGLVPIENIKVGDKVLTHKSRYRKVVKTFSRNVNNEDLTEVYGACLPFLITSNHQIFCKKHTKGRNHYLYEDWNWVESRNVKTNDRVFFPFDSLGEKLNNLDFSEFFEKNATKLIDEIKEYKKNGMTYNQIQRHFNISRGQCRGWINYDKVPNGHIYAEKNFINCSNSKIKFKRNIKMSREFGRLLGYLVSDGYAWVGENAGQVGFCFSKHQENYVDDSIYLMDKIFGIKNYSKNLINGNMWLLRYCQKFLAISIKKLIGSIKNKPGKKIILEKIISGGNNEFFKGLITGLWRGDGTIAKTYGAYATVSLPLAYQVQEVLFRLGITSKINIVRHFTMPALQHMKDKLKMQGYKEGDLRFGAYLIHVSGESFRKLSKILKCKIQKQKRKISSRSFCNEAGIESSIKTKVTKYSGMIYNIEVEEDNSYTANGIAVHNCCHVFEHFKKNERLLVLKRWFEVLKPGATLRIAVPDFEAVAKAYVNKIVPLEKLWSSLNGSQRHSWDFHYHCYDFESLKKDLESVGFINIRRYDWRRTEHADIDDYSQAYFPHLDKENGYHLSLNVEAYKPN